MAVELLANASVAEQAVIGSMLIDADCVPDVCSRLRGEDFADQTLRHLFEAARALWLEQKPIDPVTIGARAGMGDLYARIAVALIRDTPTAANVLEYADVVRRDAQLGALQVLGVQIATCRDLDEARTLLSKAAAASADSREDRCHSWAELTHAFIAALQRPAEEYFDLGIPELTKAAKMRRGQYVVLGAYNSVGKTALALQIAYGMAASGKRVGFFSLETDSLLLTQRIFAQQTETRMVVYQERRLSQDAWRRVSELSEASYDYPLYLIDAAGFSPDDIRAYTLAHRFDAVFVDYVQLLAPGDNPAQELRSVSMRLHTMAQQLGVTVTVLSQVTLPARDPKTRTRPPLRKEHLRESQQLANDADIVLLLDLSDPDDYESNRVLLMDKNKDVGQGRMLLAFDGPRMRFSYLPPFEGDDERASRERTDSMDANRGRRAEKRRKQEAERTALEAAFRELEGGADDLPFAEEMPL